MLRLPWAFSVPRQKFDITGERHASEPAETRRRLLFRAQNGSSLALAVAQRARALQIKADVLVVGFESPQPLERVDGVRVTTEREQRAAAAVVGLGPRLGCVGGCERVGEGQGCRQQSDSGVRKELKAYNMTGN